MVSKERVQQLHRILTKKYNKTITYEEVESIAEMLVDYFEILTELNKKKVSKVRISS